MAGISVGGGHGGKKSVDHELPLVPFIDLLLCCVMFLLINAVWSQLAQMKINQQQPGQANQDTPPPEQQIKVILQVRQAGFTLATTQGDRTEIPKNGDKYDLIQLRTKLQERRRMDPNRTDLILAPEDGVHYVDVVEAMDVVLGEGFSDMSVSDGAGF